jgi:hypothetical protein
LAIKTCHQRKSRDLIVIFVTREFKVFKFW